MQLSNFYVLGLTVGSLTWVVIYKYLRSEWGHFEYYSNDKLFWERPAHLSNCGSNVWKETS